MLESSVLYLSNGPSFASVGNLRTKIELSEKVGYDELRNNMAMKSGNERNQSPGPLLVEYTAHGAWALQYYAVQSAVNPSHFLGVFSSSFLVPPLQIPSSA